MTWDYRFCRAIHTNLSHPTMAHNAKPFFFLFLVVLFAIVQIEARESKFFTKAIHYSVSNIESTSLAPAQAPALAPQFEIPAPALAPKLESIAPAPELESPAPSPVEAEYGYGLFGQGADEYPSTKTTPNTAVHNNDENKFSTEELKSQSYNEYNYGGSSNNNNWDSSKQNNGDNNNGYYSTRSSSNNNNGYSTPSGYNNNNGYSTSSSYNNGGGYSTPMSNNNNDGYSTPSNYNNGYSTSSRYNNNEYSTPSSYNKDNGYSTSLYDNNNGYSTSSNYDNRNEYTTPSTYNTNEGYSTSSSYNNNKGYSTPSSYNNNGYTTILSSDDDNMKSETQGLSDNRVVNNGEYYFDVKNENYNPNKYESTIASNNNYEGYSGNGEKSKYEFDSMEEYDRQQGIPEEYIP